MRHNTTFLLTLLAMLFTACASDCMLHTYQPITNMEWDRTDTLTFEVPEVTTEGTYQLSIGLRIGNRFPYQQLAIAVETQLENPHHTHRDTLRIKFADEQGRLKGNGTTLYQFESTPLPLHLSKEQRGQVRVFHLMRHEVIPAISDVGIRINAAGDYGQHRF